VPEGQVNQLQGVMQAIAVTAERASLPQLTTLVAVLITIGSLGSVGAWLAATARLPFVVGLDRGLPAAFARLHPKWGTPYVAFLVQAAGAAVFIVLSQAGASVRGAYDALNSMALIVYFVPYLLMFAALIRLSGSPAPGSPSVSRPRRFASVALGAAGFATTAASIGFALLPVEGERHPALAVFKVAGLSTLLAGLGVLLYLRRPRGKPTV
jgi:amino acid transporter